jgi:porin
VTRTIRIWFSVIALAVVLVEASLGQEGDPTSETGSQSGFDDLPQFGGPESVSAALKQGDAEHESIYQVNWAQRNLKPYFDWKRNLHDQKGLALGFQFWSLYQNASYSLPGEDDDALGAIFRFQGAWTLFQSDTGNVGRIEYRFETRGNIGGFQAPSSLGPAVGIAALNPGFGYSEEFDLDLPVINWTQSFKDNRIGYTVGRLSVPAYLDASRLTSFNSGLLNRAFFLNPALATTGVGALGAVVKAYAGNNFWLGAHIYDANAVSGEFDFDTVQEGEWFKAVEFGLMPSYAERSSRNIQFTYWEKDDRELAGTPAGHGWAVTALYQLDEKYFPFLRLGHSNGGGGAPAEEAISAGVGITQRLDQIWSIGLGWAKPSHLTFGPGLSNETVLETSYKLQLSQNLALTPDLQIVFNPANAPNKDSVWIIGVRVALSL